MTILTEMLHHVKGWITPAAELDCDTSPATNITPNASGHSPSPPDTISKTGTSTLGKVRWLVSSANTPITMTEAVCESAAD